MKKRFLGLAIFLFFFGVPAISAKTVDYMEIRVAVVHYGLSENDLLAVQKGLEIARTFFWRNSGLQLHLHLVYIPITPLLPWTEDSRWDENIEKAITDAGYELSDFGGIFHISTDVDGTWSWGVHGNFDLGFSHSVFPVPTGVVYPVDDPSVDIGIIWIFTHEFQHALDEMYRRVGYPEMFHGDQPLVYAEKAGEHFSYQAEGLRRFTHYLGLDTYTNKWGKTWGTRKSFTDNDANGIPDDAPELPCDDRRLGPGWTKEKYMAGIYQGDLRGYLYALPSGIKQCTPRIDGTIEGSWTLLSDKLIYDAIGTTTKVYSAWDRAFLYLAGSADKEALLRVWIDLEGDGWWHGKANYEIVFNIPNNSVEVARSMDCSPETRAYDCALGGGPRDDGLCGELWDDDPRYPWGKILKPFDIISAVILGDDGVYRFELAIPAALAEGQEVGYRVVFESQGRRATVFEDYQFVHLPLLSTGPTGTLFYEDFEHPTIGWQWSGLWYLRDNACLKCDLLDGSFAYYAKPDGCTYEVKDRRGRSVRTSGTLTSPVITIPKNTTLTIEFDFFREVESYTRSTLDRTYVQIRLGTSGRTVRWGPWRTIWSRSSKDPSPECKTASYTFPSKNYDRLQIRFVFDSVNGKNNNYRGWAIDNLVVKPASTSTASLEVADLGVDWDVPDELEPGEMKVLNIPNPVRDVHTTVFTVLGVEAEEIRVEVYDLTGRLVWKGEGQGNELPWDTRDVTGLPLANGVYLYLVYVKVEGEWIVSDVQKVVILR